MLIFLLFYFGVIIGLRSFLLHKKTQVNPVNTFGKKSKHSHAERLIQLGLILLLIIGLNFCFLKSNYRFFLPFKSLEIYWLNLAGFLISIIALITTFIAQLQMKNSWRLGIDNEKETKLITTGLFGLSRNPVYIGLGFSFIGFFLIAPNLGSLIFLIIMSYAISQKVKDEEEFLRQSLPSEYAKYYKEVNRWL